MREFDPLTQISRAEITGTTLPPAGELGILKRELERGVHAASMPDSEPVSNPFSAPDEAAVKRPQGRAPLANLLDYLPSETIFVLCEPEQLTIRAEEYVHQVPASDPFFIGWSEFLAELTRREMTYVELSEADCPLPGLPTTVSLSEGVSAAPTFTSLDAFRPLCERAPEPQIAEAQRREFFAQLHRWLRQDYAVHVFCNNDGERERFEEVWKELGLGRESRVENREPGKKPKPSALSPRPSTQLGALSRGFLCDEAKLVVVTDAEIFGRYKVQRPRRLKSSHAQATRSALDIDFTELEEGDLVVHLQHGIGRYLGLQNLARGRGWPWSGSAQLSTLNSRTECLVIEYAPSDSGQPPPKLYVPVTEAHLVSKYVGAGKARPPLNTLGGTRWAKAKEHAERAVRDVAGELLRIQAARESQAGPSPFAPDATWQREFESAFIFEETPDQMRAIVRRPRPTWNAPKPMDRLICGDVGFGKTEVAIRAAFKAVMGGQAGRHPGADDRAGAAAFQHLPRAHGRLPDPRRTALALSHAARTGRASSKDLAAGAVDIVIGTHRLVQEDIAFKDLGLVVIDEEQRFGVLHKEKFKLPAHAGGRAHAQRHADSAHALPRAHRRARHEHHPNAAARPVAGRDHRHRNTTSG